MKNVLAGAATSTNYTEEPDTPPYHAKGILTDILTEAGTSTS